tara:strand:+ start:704 stop:2230 length:1527 start_codon:yes stop_codon:yes gene_type:complete
MSNSILLSAASDESNYYAQKNYGVYRVSTEFRKQGLSCQVIQFFNKFSNDELTSLIDKFSNELKLVGFSTLFWEHYDTKSKRFLIERTNFVISYIEENYPRVTIIAGGPSSRIFLNDEFTNVDAIFEGFSENDFIPYIRYIKYNEPKPLPNKYEKNVPIYNKISGNFDFNYSSTVYDPSDLITSNDVPILEVGRGCIFKCKFCAFALNGKKKFDYIKDTTVLKDELLHNYYDYGITTYILSDDTFNDSLYKVEILHELFTQLPFKIQFSCYLRLDLLLRYPTEINLLKEMGLIGAFFGIESFNKEAAKRIGKGLDPDVAKQALDDLKRIHWKNDVKIGVGLITGLPYETYDTLEQTKQWILDDNNLVDQVVPFPLSVSNPNNLRPQPWDSEFQKNAEQYGFTWPDGHSYNWHNRIGPISTRHEAVEIWEDFRRAVIKTSRQKQGGFNLLKAYPLIASQDSTLTMQGLLLMDRFSYTEFIKGIERTPIIEASYIADYKFDLLNIDTDHV